MQDMEKDVLPWLRLAEELRVLKLDAELKMPQICVMGDQSSGKSSVLEALSGIPFPRGAGLVTRCPIRMVMRRTRENETWTATVSTTVNPEQTHKAKDVPHLSSLMNKYMKQLCSDDVNFSTESVVVELISPDACDLTVVDLPGIIRTVTTGQDVQAIEQVNRLIKSCLMDERTIILAVIPANQDIATVDILERAQGVDPSGERTIGVLTKTDLIGQGAEDEIIEVVNNRRKPLTLGYTMVKNRSQKDIREGISSAKSRENESNFFSNHPVFRNCDESLCGVQSLSKKLTEVLVARIKAGLVPMRKTVERRLNEVRAELRAMPKSFSPPTNEADRRKLLVAITQQYLRYLSDCIRGEYWDRVLVRQPELRMYNTIVKKFEIFQAQVMDSAPDFKDPEFIDQLATQIRQLRGRELPGFMSQQAFHMCIAQYIDMWREPMQELIQDVHSTALDVSSKLAEVLFIQYPALGEGFKGVTERSLASMSQETGNRLQNVLNREKDPFTMNLFLPQWVNKLRYDRFKKAVNQAFDEETASDYQTVKEETFLRIRDWYQETHSVSHLASATDMAEIMEAYWNLSSKRFIDNCCMMTDNDLLSFLPARIQDSMYDFLSDDTQMQAFFVEDPHLASKKQETETTRDSLMIAFSKLSSIVPPATPESAFTTKGKKKKKKRSGGGDDGVEEEEDEEDDNDDEDGSNADGADYDVENSTADAEGAGGYSTDPSVDEIDYTVPIGELGIGLIIVHDPSSSYVVIKGFRAMPYRRENPAQAAGLRVGDRIKAINDRMLLDHNHAVNLIRAAVGEIKLTIIRKK